MLTGARAGRSSMWGGMVVALVMLAGWTLGSRVRDRKTVSYTHLTLPTKRIV